MHNESCQKNILELTAAHLTPISDPKASNCSEICIASSLGFKKKVITEALY